MSRRDTPIWPWLAAGAGLLTLAGGATMIAVAYKNGQPIGRIKLITIAGKLVEEKTAQAFRAMQAAARQAGVTLVLTSGFRTMEEQQKLYDAYRAGTGNLAAKPGYSNHQNGIAIDIMVRSSFDSPEYRWLAQHAGEYGFINTGKNFSQPEPWHWEYLA